MRQDKQARGSFLRSLLHDRTANTIVISAMALVPLMAMVGGGVDASRYYMTASRLQAACDAGALAARRAMVTDQFTTQHNQIAQSFFDQNYDDGLFGLKDRQRSFTTNGKGVVMGTASGKLPTTIMSAFGYDKFNLTVSCSADINISNTDIMFVLDVTGSMNCPDNNISGCPSGNNNDVEASNALMVGMRTAVMSFYDTVQASTSSNAQVRYGAVPYAHTVNVGGSVPAEYIANSHTYQSRVPNFTTNTTVIPGNGVRVGDEIVISDQNEWLPRSLANFGSTNWDHYRFRNSGSTARTNAQNFCWNTLPGTHSVGDTTWRISGTNYALDVFSDGDSNNRAGCWGRVRKTRIATQDDVIEDQTITETVFANYTYQPVTYDVSPLKNGGTITLPTGVQGADQVHSWNGCIEEASTVNAASFNPVPSGALDLDINLIPQTEAQRWKPQLPNATFWRRNGSTNVLANFTTTTDIAKTPVFFSCVAPAFRLTDITRPQLQAYVNGLQARGATYHDIGMIWGARFISPNGIFGADNDTAPNGDPIARHIVFMTDGALAPNTMVYSPYGMEWWDRRITSDSPPSAAQALERHEARFQAACRAAKRENISVWVVAFGTTLTDSLRTCASPGRAYQANNNTELNSAFQEIAQKIAALRLTQ
jgi:Flp pilus assembly protein TadG